MEINSIMFALSVFGIGNIVALIGFWYGVKFRLERIEEILLHSNGMVRRMECLERTLASQVALCNERHHGKQTT